MSLFGRGVDEAIRKHAVEQYPRESCGIVVNNEYVPLENMLVHGEDAFEFSAEELMRPGLQAVAHSHPNGPNAPSRADMEQQIAMDIPWGLISTTSEYSQDVFWWGPGVEMPPLIGRDFRHGPSGSDKKGDCYALVRDWYSVNQGLSLPEFPRDDNWWDMGQNMYLHNFMNCGFHPISYEDLRPGDSILAHVLSPVPNHAGIYIGNGLILHHLPKRLSREEPIARWKHLITHCLRHDGKTYAS